MAWEVFRGRWQQRTEGIFATLTPRGILCFSMEATLKWFVEARKITLYFNIERRAIGVSFADNDYAMELKVEKNRPVKFTLKRFCRCFDVPIPTEALRMPVEWSEADDMLILSLPEEGS